MNSYADSTEKRMQSLIKRGLACDMGRCVNRARYRVLFIADGEKSMMQFCNKHYARIEKSRNLKILKREEI